MRILNLSSKSFFFLHIFLCSVFSDTDIFQFLSELEKAAVRFNHYGESENQSDSATIISVDKKIQAAINAIAKGKDRTIYFPHGTYRTLKTIQVGNMSVRIRGDYQAVIDHRGPGSAFFFGLTNPNWKDPVLGGWTGGRSIVEGLRFTSQDSRGDSTSHGIQAQAVMIDVQNCFFDQIQGSGIKGIYVQYSRFVNNGFCNLGRFGIEIYNHTGTPSQSNDIIVEGNFQNIGNRLGGMYLQVQQSLISKNTFTNCGSNSTFLTIEGYDNYIVKNTLENTSQLPVTLMEINMQAGELPNSIIANTFQGNTSNPSVDGGTKYTIPLKLTGTGEADRIEYNTFNFAAVAGGKYIHANKYFYMGDNWFSNPHYAPGINSLDSYSKQVDRLVFKIDSIVLSKETNRYMSKFNLKEQGVWIVSVFFFNTFAPLEQSLQTGILSCFPGASSFEQLTNIESKTSFIESIKPVSTLLGINKQFDNGLPGIEVILTAQTKSKQNGLGTFIVNCIKLGAVTTSTDSR